MLANVLVRPGSNVEAQPGKVKKINKLCINAFHIAASVARLDSTVNTMFMLRSVEGAGGHVPE